MKIVIVIVMAIACYALITMLTGCTVVKTQMFNEGTSKANIYYNLPKGLLKITSTAECLIYTDQRGDVKDINLVSQAFQIETELVPDSTATLKLSYINNPLSKDDIDIKINEKGLLSNVDVVVEDRLPNIIEALSKAPSEILVSSSKMTQQDQKPPQDSLTVTSEEFTRIFLHDPSQKLDTISWSIQKTNLNQNRVTQDLSFIVKSIPEAVTSTNNRPSPYIAKNVKGIVTRPVSLNKFSISFIPPELENNEFFFYEYLPDLTRQLEIPMSRALFSKKTNNLVFKDGLISENKLNKPSEVEGFVSIPINLAKSIFSIPSQLFQFKIDNTKKKTELEKEILNLEQAIQDNKENKQLKSLASKTAQLEAEKNYLSLLKEIQGLKAELKKDQQQAH